MYKKVAIAGAYGTGKTTLSLILSEQLGYDRVHVNNISDLYQGLFKTTNSGEVL